MPPLTAERGLEQSLLHTCGHMESSKPATAPQCRAKECFLQEPFRIAVVFAAGFYPMFLSTNEGRGARRKPAFAERWRAIGSKSRAGSSGARRHMADYPTAVTTPVFEGGKVEPFQSAAAVAPTLLALSPGTPKNQDEGGHSQSPKRTHIT